MIKVVDGDELTEPSIRLTFLELNKALDKQDLHPDDRLVLRGMLEVRMLVEIDRLDRRKKTTTDYKKHLNYKQHMKRYGR